MTEFPLHKAFQFLEPGPVLLLSTSRGGAANVMTLSWHVVLDFTPRFACVVSPGNYSYQTLRQTGECVLAIPGADLIETVVDIGNCSGRDLDKFAAFGLTALPAATVKAPLVGECLANLECRVADSGLVEEHCLFIMDCTRAWTNPDREDRRTFHANGDGTFVLDGPTLNLKTRMTKWPEFI